MSIASVSIYTLSDPQTKEVRYVGKTSDLNSRFTQHKIYLGTDKCKWILRLKKQGLSPIIAEVELCGDLFGDYRERFYIDKFIKEGHNLFNIQSRNLDTPTSAGSISMIAKAKFLMEASVKGINPNQLLEKIINERYDLEEHQGYKDKYESIIEYERFFKREWVPHLKSNH